MKVINNDNATLILTWTEQSSASDDGVNGARRYISSHRYQLSLFLPFFFRNRRPSFSLTFFNLSLLLRNHPNFTTDLLWKRGQEDRQRQTIQSFVWECETKEQEEGERTTEGAGSTGSAEEGQI